MKRTLLVLLVALGVAGVAPASSVPAISQASSVPTISSNSPASPTPPATSVSVAASRRTTTARENATEYPPGLSADGVTDPLALADAHRATLRNTSYTVTAIYTLQRPNGTMLGHAVTTTRVAPGGTSYYTVSSQLRSNESRTLGLGGYDVAVWANETAAVWAERSVGEEPTYRLTSRRYAPVQLNRHWELLYGAFGATDTTVVQRFERDGRTLFRVVSTGRPGPESSYPRRSGYGFVAAVDSRGVVHSFQQTYRTTFRDRPAVVSRTVRVTRVGNTAVERPDWYEQAMANATETTVR